MTADPASKLVYPTAEVSSNLVDSVIHVPDWLNSSKWFTTIMETKLQANPFREVGEAFAGDWGKVQQAGKALKNVAAYNREYASGLRNEITRLTGDTRLTNMASGTGDFGLAGRDAPWVGNAASSANPNLIVLAARLESQAPSIEAGGGPAHKAAEAMESAAHTIETLLSLAFDAIADWAIIAIAVAAAGPVGVVIGVAKLASLTARALKTIGDVRTYIAITQAQIDAIKALITQALNSQGADALNLVALPRGSFDHPGVQIDAGRF